MRYRYSASVTGNTIFHFIFQYNIVGRIAGVNWPSQETTVAK
ncbi:hypothetical protein [Bacteroides sp.]